MQKILIANRGEIACRIIRTCKKMGISTVAVYSEADKKSKHVQDADQAVCIGPAPAARSYLDFDNILKAAKETHAEGIHPGYGFNSENPEFAEFCKDNGITFIGPTAESMRVFSTKHKAREMVKALGVPVVPGSMALVASEQEIMKFAEELGYPLMVKPTAGGGGIGMHKCDNADSLRRAFTEAQKAGEQFFKQGGVFVERYIETPRHIEVQIFGDGKQVIHLGERECSIQRRNQKIIEETPAPISDEIRIKIHEAAVCVAKAVNYESAGTVEFIMAPTGEFYFLEMNTRLQVEHGVTEMVTGIDLVEWMILHASGNSPDLASYQHKPEGHSIQVRLYAENPEKNFMPSPGELKSFILPEKPWSRYDGWVESGTTITPFYDPLIAKILVHGENRPQAIARQREVLSEAKIEGIHTNLLLLQQILANQEFAEAKISTTFLQGVLGYKKHPTASAEIKSPLIGSVWKVFVKESEHISRGQEIMILESMKMEFPVIVEMDGIIKKLPLKEGDMVKEDDVLVILEAIKEEVKEEKAVADKAIFKETPVREADPEPELAHQVPYISYKNCEGLTNEDLLTASSDAVIKLLPQEGDRPRVVYRLAGDAYILVEYGPVVLDFKLRFRVHALEERLKAMKIKGLQETAPGVRSLWIKYDGLQLPLNKLMDILVEQEATLPPAESMEVSSRILRLPAAFREKWTQEAIEKYMALVRKEGPWLPDNVAFVARCNGLSGPEEAIAKYTSTQQMVFGLGDVYLGAPCAVALDPRCRLVVPKYNPARTWTPEGGIGNGGAYICIYPMASPGGYQLIGRTISIWNTFQTRPAFENPWLLRNFDRIEFNRVTEQELEEIRATDEAGKYEIQIEEGTFKLKEYLDFLETIKGEVAEFQKIQKEQVLKWTVGY